MDLKDNKVNKVIIYISFIFNLKIWLISLRFDFIVEIVSTTSSCCEDEWMWCLEDSMYALWGLIEDYYECVAIATTVAFTFILKKSIQWILPPDFFLYITYN